MTTIKSKIIVNILLVFLILASIIGLELSTLSRLGTYQDEGAKRSNNLVAAMETSMAGLALYRVIAKAEIERDLDKITGEWISIKGDVLKNIDASLRNSDTPQERKLNEDAKNTILEIVTLFEQKLMPILEETQIFTTEIKRLDSDIRVRVDKIESTMDQMVKTLEQKMIEADKEFDIQRTIATRLALIIGLIGILLQLCLSGWLLRAILKPIGALRFMLMDMAQGEGDLTRRLDTSAKDELAEISVYFNQFLEKLHGVVKDIVGDVQSLTTSSSELTKVSRDLSSAARDTADKSSMVAAAAEEMNSNIQAVSAAMEQTASNVNMVAAAAEEMNATVGDIAHNAEKARAISQDAVTQSQHTSEKMANLGDSAQKIGRVTETITEISEQTNLLALNATIEAARAGEAGKGFAVVANEIKELARQTAEATIDIKNQISEMQETTATTVKDIQTISSVIAEINDVIGGIATAVEEQSATSGEIAANISQISQGSAEVNENVAQSTVVVAGISRDIRDINQQSQQVGAGSALVQTSAQTLSDLATHLDSLAGKFKV